MGYGATFWSGLSNYLSGRRQFVFVNNELSDSGLVKAGVPQVSVLGPLLYLLYINDITDNLGNLARLFADDTSLSYSGKNFYLMIYKYWINGQKHGLYTLTLKKLKPL